MDQVGTESECRIWGMNLNLNARPSLSSAFVLIRLPWKAWKDFHSSSKFWNPSCLAKLRFAWRIFGHSGNRAFLSKTSSNFIFFSNHPLGHYCFLASKILFCFLDISLAQLIKHACMSLTAWPRRSHFSVVQLDCWVRWWQEVGVRMAFSVEIAEAVWETCIPVFKQCMLNPPLHKCTDISVRDSVRTALR